MKRGLKVKLNRADSKVLKRYNRYPDEKGTESEQTAEAEGPLSAVTTVTPMKRGLKVDHVVRLFPICDRLQPLPR